MDDLRKGRLQWARSANFGRLLFGDRLLRQHDGWRDGHAEPHARTGRLRVRLGRYFVSTRLSNPTFATIAEKRGSLRIGSKKLPESDSLAKKES